MDEQNRNRTPKSLTLAKQTWERVDSLRGDIPRSRFVEKLVIGGLEETDQ